MARRAPAADSTEGSFALDHSGPSNNDSLLNDDSASSDYFSDFFDLDQLTNIEFGNVNENGGVVNDDETDDEDILSRTLAAPHSQQASISRQPPPAQSASQPVPTTNRPQLSYGSQAGPTQSDRDRLQHILQPSFRLPLLAPPALAPAFPLPLPAAAPSRTLNHSDSAINIDDDEDDDLAFLGQNDFSSPSILNESPSRVSQQITLSDDDDGVIMPQTRRRSAASRSSVSAIDPFPLPLPGDTIAATPARSSRNRAGSNAILSSPAAAASTTPSAVRTSTKRRRSNDLGIGSSSTALPPIATVLASVGNGSSSSSSSNNGRAAYGDSQASSSGSNSGGNNATSQTSRPRLTPKRPRVVEPIILDDDLFGSDDDDVGVEMVNLVDVDRPQATTVKDEAPSEENAAQEAAEAKAEPKNLTKLSGQQCVICMDDMTDITVTHCGHLFCGECLYSSLNSTEQRVCPICRSKVEFRVPQMSAAKMSRSYFHLQIKMRPRQ